MKKIILAFVMFATSITYAQTLKGKVLNEEGKPLSDVGIFNKRSGNHSHSN